MRKGPASLGLRLAAAPLAALVVVAGLWVSGGLITNDFTLAMWLTVAWMAVAGLVALAVALRTPAVRWPILAGYTIVALGAGLYLGSSLFFENRVDENVARAASPASGAGARGGGGAGPGTAAAGEPTRNVALRSGPFESVRHAATGEATFIRLAEGGRVVTLTDFEVDNGPDLRLYLAAGAATTESEVSDYVDLGALQGNVGDQQYEIPADLDVSRYSTVVVWCRAFSVLFARAPTGG